MKNRISIYAGKPIQRLLADEKNVSGRLNEICDRYYALIKKEAVPLTSEEKHQLKSILGSRQVDPLFIEYIQDEMASAHFPALAKTFENASFAQKLAAVESVAKR